VKAPGTTLWTERSEQVLGEDSGLDSSAVPAT
jgi:hypothetical protein